MAADRPFVGREAELRVLGDALDAAAGGAPAAFEVAGPAGIGKTRLLAEIAARAEAAGAVVLSGAASEFERDLPYGMLIAALDEHVEGLEPRRVERLGEETREGLGHVLPAFARGPGGPPAGAQARPRAHRAVRDLLEQLAATRPLVLLLDDLHWADDASVELVVALLRRMPDAGVVLVLGTRPRQLPPPVAAAFERALRESRLTRLVLTGLSTTETRVLLGRDAVDPVTHALHEETGGNPFYLEQLARTVTALPEAGPDAPTWIAGVEVPPMVAAALTEELGALTATGRQLLEGAAVTGDPFEIDLAAVAAAVEEPAALDALDELLRCDLVRPTEAPRRFRFRHPIVRRAVYDGTLAGRRLAAHARAADALAASGGPAAARAHHVERSARAGDVEAVAVLREAGAASAERAPSAAAHWFAAALRLLPPAAPAAERVELLAARGRALAATGRYAASRDAFAEAAALVPPSSPEAAVRIAATLARIEHLLGRDDDAHERLAQAFARLPQEVSPEGVALMTELARDGAQRMDYASMLAWGERACDAARRLGDPALVAAAVAAAALSAGFAGETARAQAGAEEAAGLLGALDERALGHHLDAMTDLAGARLHLHRFADAEAQVTRALAVGRATGQEQLFPLAFGILGISRFFGGRLADAVEPLEEAIDASRASGNARAVAWNLYARSMVAYAAGDVPTATSAAQEAIDVLDGGRPSHHRGYAAFAQGQVLLHLGDADGAAAVLEDAGGGPDVPLVAQSYRPYALELLVRARLALGRLEAAADAAAHATRSAERLGLPLATAWADRARAAVDLAAGDPQAAAGRARRAADAAAAAGAPLESARAAVVAGRALAACEDADAAAAELEAAAARFERAGALGHRNEAERELRRLGRHIHRRSGRAAAGGGLAALTARELEIARQIADRRTNREIAGALYLSPKTVETHIRNIFGKLDARSRVEVARIVDRADEQERSAAG